MMRSGGFREWEMRVFLGVLFITVFFQPFHSFQSCLFGETDNNPVRRYGIKAIPCDPRTDFKEIFLVRNWESLPHKNQEESRSQCDADNKMLGKNRVDYSPRFPVMACLAFGASTVTDWWSLEMGLPLEEFTSFYHGRTEKGCNPRALEAEYFLRAKQEPRPFLLVPFRDPIVKTRVPFNPLGYARILVGTSTETLPDPLLPRVFYNRMVPSPMNGKWLSLFHHNMGKDHSEVLKQALKNFGPVYVSLDFTPVTVFLPGMHSVGIIGYGVPKSSPGRTVFILHDSYGDFPKDFSPTEKGGPSYRYLSSRWIDTAIVFPHQLFVKAFPEDQGIRLTFLNSGNQPVPIRSVRLTNSGFSKKFGKDGSRSVVIPKKVLQNIPGDGWLEGIVEADFYADEHGSGQSFKVKAGKEGITPCQSAK